MADVTRALHDTADEYRAHADDDRPLGGYLGLLASYSAAFGVLALLGRKRLPGTLSMPDLALGAIATHKLSRIITEEPITSPLRAPVARYEGVAGPGEVHEEARGTGWRHAVGELVTCPFCVGQWVATALVVGMTVAPRFTRTFISVLVMVTASDFLQFAYAKAQQIAED